jgi:8-oxo-dGTP pyrophosphatase MutT (NUDIX family)
MTRAALLARSLAAFAPSNDTESEHRRRMLTLTDASGDPCARDHFVPGHFTASAFVLDPSGTALLLIFHEKFRRWLQPGGHVEPNDADLVAAALREVAEETGLSDADVVGEGWFDLDVHDIPARKGDPAHQHFDVRVLLQARSGELSAGSDALAARWVPLAEVETIETDESVMRAVRKLRSRR